MLTHTITQNRITEGTPITYVCTCCNEGTPSAVQIHSSFIHWYTRARARTHCLALSSFYKQLIAQWLLYVPPV